MKDLNLLYVFEAIWIERSVTLAAERLDLTQAAVSSALKRLRHEHGDKLFTQVGRRMEPTPYASSIAQQLLTALALVRKASNRQAPFDPATSRRQFTIRTRDVGEVVCFPRILAQLVHEGPHVRLRTTFVPIEETLAGLASGRIDLAMGFLPSLETDIHRRSLGSQSYVCVMRAGHPLERQTLTAQRFRSCDHLLVEYSGSGHRVIEQGLIKAGLRHQIKVRLPQYLSAPHFILSTDLLWCVPSTLAHTLSHHYPLVIKPVPIELPDFEIALYWHERYHQDLGNRWLRELIVQTYQPKGLQEPELRS